MPAHHPAEGAPGAPPVPPPLLDDRRLETLREALGEGLADMAAMFPDALAEELSTLAGALARGDAEGTAAAAHGLKGMAANFGAERLRGLAEAMQAAPAAAGAAGLMEEILRVADLTSAALRERFDGGAAP